MMGCLLWIDVGLTILNYRRPLVAVVAWRRLKVADTLHQCRMHQCRQCPTSKRSYYRNPRVAPITGTLRGNR